ncbi:DUF6612 family protein [Virgibacillus litoralis]|uniref:DUF4362 domain-containing protein n=1 Tax=Virgibacillus litoralis TaxID=578221 RepID=A0ABS4HJG3_9BACI|nr:DUF6612 family protein [Virgibacillus litoralis]MBP1950537.1 hypothetical protein [Virgibacillus litoralis]
MKKLTGFILMGITLLLMTACSEEEPVMNDETNKNTVEETEATTEEVNEVGEEQQDDDDETGEKKKQPNEDDSNQSDEQTNTDDTNMEETNQSEDATAKLTDAAAILRKSSEAMKNVDSLYMGGTTVSDAIINDVKRIEIININADMMIGEQKTLHQTVKIEANDEPDSNMEMYLNEEMYYLKENNKWISMEAEYAVNNLYNTVFDEQLSFYSDYSSLFQVTDEEDHYILSYSGTDEEFKEIVFGAGQKVLNDFFRDFYHNMKVTGIYKLTIDKQTFYLTNYLLEYEATTSGEAGKGHIYEKSEFSYGNFNAYVELIVPQEVREAAEPVK